MVVLEKGEVDDDAHSRLRKPEIVGRRTSRDAEEARTALTKAEGAAASSAHGPNRMRRSSRRSNRAYCVWKPRETQIRPNS